MVVSNGNERLLYTWFMEVQSGTIVKEVKDLLLSQIEEVKLGNFPDWLVNYIVPDLKLSQIKKMETNSGRSTMNL